MWDPQNILMLTKGSGFIKLRNHLIKELQGVKADFREVVCEMCFSILDLYGRIRHPGMGLP